MIFVDSHVHIHNCFDIIYFLSSALLNFKKAAARKGQGEEYTAAIILAQGKERTGFQEIINLFEKKDSKISKSKNGWTFNHTDENCSIYVKDKNEKGFFIIGGRQIVSAENLELLALCTNEYFEDGIPLKELIRTVKGNKGIPVVPWGFGKWVGKRGLILEKLIEDVDSLDFFLGDNSGRPRFWPIPHHFKLAHELDIRILPGSDPLPFKSEYYRAGSFGFFMDGTLTSTNPAIELKNKLENRNEIVSTYGKIESLTRFFRNQLGMQIKKRF
jgi:hypothetical protein